MEPAPLDHLHARRSVGPDALRSIRIIDHLIYSGTIIVKGAGTVIGKWLRCGQQRIELVFPETDKMFLPAGIDPCTSGLPHLLLGFFFIGLCLIEADDSPALWNDDS